MLHLILTPPVIMFFVPNAKWSYAHIALELLLTMMFIPSSSISSLFSLPGQLSTLTSESVKALTTAPKVPSIQPLRTLAPVGSMANYFKILSFLEYGGDSVWKTCWITEKCDQRERTTLYDTYHITNMCVCDYVSILTSQKTLQILGRAPPSGLRIM